MKIIKNYNNYTISKDGIIRNIKTNKILTPVIKNGYYGVRLSKNGKVIYKSVHTLVYESYIGERTKGMQIDHIDGVRTNNNINNLREVTPEQNNTNRKNLVRGENVNTSKLTEQQVIDIRKRKQMGESSLKLANEYCVLKSTINRVASGKTWKHLPILNVDNSKWGNPKLTGSMSGIELRKKYGDDYFSKIAKGNKVIERCKYCGHIINK